MWDTSGVLVQVDQYGNIELFPPSITTTSCKTDVANFPFDEKHCVIIFGSWAFTSDVINLTTNSVQLDQYVRNGEWSLISTKQTVKLITFQGQNGSYSLLYIDLYFRRRTLFYTFNFILPNLILDLLTCFSFMLPPERGEKVGVCK